MDEIVIGPFLSRRIETKLTYPDVEDTGYDLEFATAVEAYRLPIFRCDARSGGTLSFEDFTVREDDMPFGVECFNFQVKELHGGPYIMLTAFLAALYRRYKTLSPIKRFFVDFAEQLPFGDSQCRLEDASAYPLRAEIAKQGYVISSVVPYGRRIFVDFAWRLSPKTCPNINSFLFAGIANFRPQPDQTLDRGKWIPPRKHFVQNLLFSELRTLSETMPANLLSEEAELKMLAEFEWTPLALMTQKQARNSRIEFVKANAELAKNPKELAKALQAAKLYSQDTSLSQIRKFLPSLLKAAHLAA